MIRCNNCGVLNHRPQACPNYGFYYPAPGKTREDYLEDRQRVQDLFAADIIREHQGHDEDDAVRFTGARPGPVKAAESLEGTCGWCGSLPGQRCRTSNGKETPVHKTRVDALDSGPPGM